MAVSEVMIRMRMPCASVTALATAAMSAYVAVPVP